MAVDLRNGDRRENPSDNKSETSEVEEASRGNWGGQLEFILTCVGYAVGLGNVWRFPYLCYKNGGGAFLIPYFSMLVLVGMPLFFLELSFGQFASLGPLAIWQVSPLMKGVGFAMVITNTFIALYYNVIIAWSFYYFFASMTDKLPFEDCSNPWNDQNCHTSQFLKENCTILNTSEAIRTYECYSCWRGEYQINGTDIETPSEQYFYNNVLQLSSGLEEMGSIVWQLGLLLGLSWLIVFFVLIKGIGSLGKVVYFTSIFPYVLLTIMLIRGVTLEGADQGIEYYLKPDFSKLGDATVWSEATTQIFFSLSACTGGLIAMASYNKFHNNCLRDSIIVPLINCGTSFYAGFAIFSVLGFMAEEKGVPVDVVADEGPGLVFVVYPEALTQMPVAPLWAILFFFMLITLGFSSEFAMTECTLSAVADEFPNLLRGSKRNNFVFRAIVIFCFYLITLPFVTEGGFYLFSVVDKYVSGFPLLFVGMFESTVLMWMYGYTKYAEDVYLMLGKHPNIFFKATWCVITPVLLLAIIIFTAVQHEPYSLFDGEYDYPGWGDGIGWIVTVIPLICIPIVFVYRIMADGGCEAMKSAAQSTEQWGPALKQDKKGRYTFSGMPDISFSSDLKSKPWPPNHGLSTSLNNRPSAVYTIPVVYPMQDKPVYSQINHNRDQTQLESSMQFKDDENDNKFVSKVDVSDDQSTPRSTASQGGGHSAIHALDEAIMNNGGPGMTNNGFDHDDEDSVESNTAL